MLPEKRELKLSELPVHRPHYHVHVPHYHPPHNHNHDFSGLGSGLTTSTLLFSNPAVISPIASTLVTVAVVAIPVVLIGGLIWWACQES